MDPRDKNKQAQQHQQEQQQQRTQKREHQLEVEEQIKTATPEQLRSKLSNKNEDYLFRLQKSLTQQGKTSQQAQTMVDDLLQEVLDNQIKGIPARQLYGSVTTKVEALIHKKTPKATASNTPTWQMAVDNSLLFVAIFAIMYGVMSLFIKHPSRQNQSGILSILVIAIVWGILFGWLNKRMLAEDHKREPFWKTILIIVIGLLIMFFVWMLTVLVPPVLNPILPAWAEIVIAVVAYAARWGFRKYYHITFSSFTGR